PSAHNGPSARTKAATASSGTSEAMLATIFMATIPVQPACRRTLGSVVQQAIELRPDLVLLGTGLMAKCALRLRPQLGGRGLGLVMIEVVVSPAAAGLRVPLGVLDGHVGAVEFPGEITPARRLQSRTVGELLGLENPLQFLEEDRAFGKFAGLLVDLVGSRFDVDVVVFGESCLAVVQRVGRQRGAHVYP